VLRKTGGAGTTTLGTALVNSGDVQVQSGTLNVAGTYQGMNGILSIAIFGATNYGHVAFGSALNLTGTLAAQLNGGYLPNDGDTFTLLTYPSRTGSFTTLNLPPEAVWQVTNAQTAFVITASSVCTPPANGLVAWWPGEGSAGDLVGANDGTLSNGVAFAAGEVGQAFSFNGIDQYVSTPTALTNIANDFTLEFWAYPTAALAVTTESNNGISGTSGQRYAVFPYLGGAQDAGAGVSVGTNGISIFEYGANFLPSPLVYQSAITGWTHVAVVYTNKQPMLYVNGALARIGLASLRSSVHPSAEFGGSMLAYGYYAGLLDEISIYNRALASNEVAAIYSAGSSGKCKGSVPPTILTQPANQLVLLGGTALFNVVANGSPPLFYQWWFNQTNLLASATNSSLTLSNVDASYAGLYSVVVSNAFGAVGSSPASLSVSNVPDLAPVSVVAPASGVSGTPIQVACVVTNQGTGAASGYWADGVYFSTNGVLDTSATLLAYVPQTHNVAAGSSYGWTNSTTLPQVRSGLYYLFVVVDDPKYGYPVYEVTKTNNTSAALALTTLTPDLVPLSLLSPTTITSTIPNPTVQIVLAVTNQGNGSAVGCWYDWLYLSTNASLAGSIASGAWYNCWNLAPNGSYSLTNDVVLSLGQSGTYYLLFKTDGDNRLYESDENNNVSSAVPLVFSLTQPDLLVSSLSVPTTAQIPGPLQVVYTMTNAGIAVASGPWQNQLLLATNASGGGAQNVGSVVFTGSIPVGGYVTVTQAVALAAVNLGTRFPGIFVDSANNVLESNEANNTAFAPTSTEITAPDLAVIQVAAPASAVIAQPVPVVITITNQGDAVAAGPWLNQILLADNANGTGAQSLGAFSYTNLLAAGSSTTVTQTVILPPSIIGTNYFGLFVDSGGTVAESNETNNVLFATNAMVINAPDLVLAQLGAPASAQFGQTFAIHFTVTNAGGADAIGSWNDQLYFGAYANSLAGATLLATLAGTSPLSSGSVYTHTQAVVIPLTLSSVPGTYYLTASADSGNTLSESTKTNNLLAIPIGLTLPALPDLTVGQVASPGLATAGQTVSVSWSVTNLGAATAINPWREKVYLLPASTTLSQFSASPSAYVLVGAFTYTNDLVAGSSVTRTEQVAVPVIGLAGGLRVAVWVDSDNNVIEQNETNNTALAFNDLQVPLVLSLALPVTNVLENTPIPNLPCLVSRNGDLSSPLVVSLNSSGTSHLQVPPSVMIPANAASAPFNATVLDDGIPGPDALVTISANAGSYQSVTAQVLVMNTDVPGLILSLASAQISLGQTVAATLSLSMASRQPVVAAISSSSPSELVAPLSVTIPANSNSVTFSLLAPQSTIIAPAKNYTVGASASGYAGTIANLTVLNNNAPMLALSLDPTNISEAGGPFAAVGTVSRAPVSDQAVTIALASTNTGAAVVPAQVTIPGLQAAVSFYVSAIHDTNVTGPKVTLISAQGLDNVGNPVGTAATQILTVQDIDGPSLQVLIANKVVPKGTTAATTAVVWTALPPTNDLVVALSSSDTKEATVPATVTIPLGQTNATFSITSLDDGIPSSSHSATITASATNYASGSDVLTVSDIGLPDLVIASITAPGTAFPAESLSLGFRLLNQGVGTLTNGVTQNVYLTTDPIAGSYLLVGAAYFPGPLAPGQFVDESVLVPGNLVPSLGTYWVVVAADANDNAAELNEGNNNRVSTAPVLVTSEYSAIVYAGTANALVGTSIPLTGSATLSFGGPATNKPVDILLTVRGLQRVIVATTDANGNFSTLFNPLPNEAGFYTVTAVAPGVASAPTQDQFNILGMSSSRASLNLSVIQSGNMASAATLQNMSEVPLTGLTATLNGVAPNLVATATLKTNYLAGQGSLTLSVNVTASDASVQQSSFTIRLASAEGAILDLPVTVTVNLLVPRLATYPSQLSASMLRGGQTVLQFDVVNVGGAATGPLTVNPPAVPWFSVASTNPMPSLAPGQSNRVTVVLSPATDLALGPYTGTLALNGSGTGLQVPFLFNCVSDAHGAVMVRSVDEFTFFAAGAPPLANASVTLIDPFSGTVITNGVTDGNGLFLASGLMEGTYQLSLTADKHTSFRGGAVVTANHTNAVEAFLSVQTVTYVWTVVPTQVQDVTTITVQAQFEANVPAPVVVPSPASLDLAPLTQPGQFMDVPFTLSNLGLIGVQNVGISISPHPLYRFDLVTTNIGVLPAHGTYTIPMRITRLAGPHDGGVPCSIGFGIGYIYLCGQYDISSGIAIPVFDVSGDCISTSGGGTTTTVGCLDCGGGLVVGGPVGGGGGGGTVELPPEIDSSPSSCDQCMAKAVLECAIGYTPVGCAYGAWSCYGNVGVQGINASTAENCIQQGVGCLGPIGNTASCLWSFLRCKCSGSLLSIPGCILDVVTGGAVIHPLDATVGLGLSPLDPRDVYVARSYSSIQFIRMLVGDTDGRWLSSGSGGAFGAWFNLFNQAIQTNGPAGAMISPEESAGLLASPRPNTVSLADVQATIDRWNLSITNWEAGMFSPTNIPPGGNTNFIDLYALGNQMSQVGQDYQASQAEGYDSPFGGFFAALQNAESKLGGGGTCAHIVLQLDQKAVLTRDAFSATLQLGNSGTDPLTNVTVNLVVQNQAGQDVTSLFGIGAPILGGNLTAIDGTGSLAAGATGQAQWTLLPSLDAAPQAPTNYLVSGTFSYTLNGATITIPLSPATISVQPNPELYLKYFLQRDVFADDPYTPAIEPSIPFPLAVMMQNKGYGMARDFQITSAQPTIVDNQKGLLISFQIIGTEIAGQPATPSLTANFGDLAPGGIKIGEWFFTSTLQGLFTDYKATFQHVDPLGNPRLSLIQGVEIHEMTHLVRAEGAWDDGQPDFLTVETANFDSLPDTLYLSDGTKQPVSVVQTGTPDGPATAGHLQVQLTANFPAGFTYLLVADPANGQFPLLGVQHSNGSNFLAENFYITDRTFIGLAQPPIHENKLHLFDYHTNAGPDTYTLVYVSPTNSIVTNPPVSSVFVLPAQSPPTFGVAWSGAPYAGGASLAYYDIYVSDNGGPFTVWQSHTTATGAIFNGTDTHTYAFYSLATDTAGHRETPPLQPQAITSVNGTNYPPTISVASSVTINAGQTLLLTVTANDPNPFSTLTFSLGSGAPSGMTIDAITGLITWPTSPAYGGTTNTVHVIVSDNGQPPLSATGVVSVAVLQLVSPPVLAPIGNYTISEGTLLIVTNTAVDNNLPPRPLVFSLGAGAPKNAIIDPAAGVFQWRPSAAQAPSTNIISVIVTDNGVPTLSATQQFKVVVSPVRFEFVLSLGSTNVLVGRTASVPVVLQSSLPLTNITAIVQAPASSVTNLTLLGASPEVLSTLLQPLGTNLYSINLALNPALSPGNLRILAQLGFLAPLQTHSAIAPLALPQLTGTQADGSAAAKPGTGNGRVFVIGREPLLDAWFGTDFSRKLALYGNPGSSYELDFTTNLLGGNWQFGWRLPMTNTFEAFDANGALPQVYYRAVEFSADPPILELNSYAPTNLVLRLYGQNGTNYMIMTGTNLADTSSWTPVVGFTLTNSFQFINAAGATNQQQYFRAKRP
jgi:subtilase family serine protease